jgi:lipopolysaccharide transport system permease protein
VRLIEQPSYLKSLISVPRALRDLYRYWYLIKILSSRDFKVRYRGSLAGMSWAVIQPLFMIFIYTVVFSRFFGVRFGVNNSPYEFALYLMCGLLPWNAFTEGFTTSSGLIRNNTNLIKRVVFPVEILPITLTFVTVFQQLIGLGLLIPFVFLFYSKLNWTILLLPIVLFFQILFYIGINFFWTGFSVYLPDLRHLTSLLITGLIFLAPFLYPLSLVPEGPLLVIIKLNPFTSLITLYRGLILDGIVPSFTVFAYFGFISALIFVLGFSWFMWSKHGFAEAL